MTDPQLDVAVIKTRAALQVMPWKIGRSAGIRERNLVEVRGFPLGAFRATNIGKVISAHDHDDYATGITTISSSTRCCRRGIPARRFSAISCATGEYELVGIYHAGYSEGAALNVVVGIDQIRDLMSTLKRTTRDREESVVSLDGAARALVARAVGEGRRRILSGGRAGRVARQAGDGALLLALFTKDFPANGEPGLVVEDLPPPDPGGFGTVGRVWLGSARGLKPCDLRALDAESQAQIKRALAVMRSDSRGAGDVARSRPGGARREAIRDPPSLRQGDGTGGRIAERGRCSPWRSYQSACRRKWVRRGRASSTSGDSAVVEGSTTYGGRGVERPGWPGRRRRSRPSHDWATDAQRPPRVAMMRAGSCGWRPSSARWVPGPLCARFGTGRGVGPRGIDDAVRSCLPGSGSILACGPPCCDGGASAGLDGSSDELDEPIRGDATAHRIVN